MVALPARRQTRGGVGGDVRARLVDDGDDAERDAPARDLEPVGPRPLLDRFADRIGQRGDLAHRADDLADALVVEAQAIDHRRRQPGLRAPRARPRRWRRGSRRAWRSTASAMAMRAAVRRSAPALATSRPAALASRASCSISGHVAVSHSQYEIVAMDDLVGGGVAEERGDARSSACRRSSRSRRRRRRRGRGRTRCRLRRRRAPASPAPKLAVDALDARRQQRLFAVDERAAGAGVDHERAGRLERVGDPVLARLQRDRPTARRRCRRSPPSRIDVTGRSRRPDATTVTTPKRAGDLAPPAPCDAMPPVPTPLADAAGDGRPPRDRCRALRE